MIDKFNLNIEENIFLAKKKIVQSIYDSAKLEGCNVTFPQTEVIVNGSMIPNIDVDDLQKVLNLRNAWKYILENMNKSLSLDYICKINGFIAYNESLEWGVLRTGEVGISGTNYIPDIPEAEKVVENLKNILTSDKSETEKGIELFLYGCRSQLFWDGNKSTSIIMANKYLISKGRGVLSIPENKLDEFASKLSYYYETNETKDVKQFLYDNAIKGMEVQKELKKVKIKKHNKELFEEDLER